jgi:hypothetical protein
MGGVILPRMKVIQDGLKWGLFLVPAMAFADCRVYVPQKEFLHDSGYSIRFDFESILAPRGYQEVFEASASDHVLRISGQEVSGRLHRARAEMTFRDLHITEEKVCFTQWCGIQDYAAAFRKAYRSLGRRMQNCL